jgi:hypothetical protein
MAALLSLLRELENGEWGVGNKGVEFYYSYFPPIPYFPLDYLKLYQQITRYIKLFLTVVSGCSMLPDVMISIVYPEKN